MDYEEIAEFAAVLRESPLAELEVRQGDRSLRLRRAEPGRKAAPKPPEQPPAPTAAPPARTHTPARQPDTLVPGATPVTAGLVGIFHHSPTPVAEGTVVAEREVLGRIESMRIMNDCLAPRAGRIVRIRVEDGQPVMYGQILFEIADVDADTEAGSDEGSAQ